ncbi:30S ribosomal protein S1 [Bifidobacterium bombi]|uniref:Small ribosomal subunit protein bS1 n=2 Tax=Bifidobacterium bombi TaxID=471511 RepID=A0A080N2I7_9BIFI|nr:30S ribosomal protein S1 [Bifidobacterium bombi]KFF31197.1 30S ribosomal protein S1P [Bifidobacterium bombi DSM 19703]
MAENNNEVAKVAINDIGTEEDFIKAVDSTIKNFDDGDLVHGTVVKVDHDEVLLDIGYKTEGVIPSRELSIKKEVDPDEVVQLGDEIEALVVTKEDKEGRLILSKKRAQYERAWDDIEKIKNEDGVVEGTVIEAVKGGLIVDIGLRGFLPASLVEMRRVRDLSPYIGQKIQAKILELDKNRNNVVLSRRQYLEETQSEVRETFLAQLKKGQIREGVVSSIVNFGAFVDLGGVDGLIHVSELSWRHIDHPSAVVKVGDKVTVEVLDVDLERERISLSLKATQEDPWQRFARTHVPGQIVKGKVTKIVQFGVFISVEDGIEGLVHISELAARHVDNPETVVHPGEEIFVKVIDVDLDRRRISLSLKQANDSLSDDFDPALYGMPADYDDEGNYKYPEGFDPQTNEWMAGYEKQRQEWESQYAAANQLWEEHKAFVAKQNEEAEQSAAEDGQAEGETHEPAETNYTSASDSEGTLADSDQLAALREKLINENK